MVLWSLVLLALLGTRITAAGRAELQLAGNLRDAAVVEAAADGAVHAALFHLLGGERWPPAGRHRVRVPDAVVDIQVEDLAGRVNPNAASLELLRALLREAGADPLLASAIMDWRTPGQVARPGGAKAREYRAAGRSYGPPGAPFRSLDELGAVLGMTPGLLARLRPHLTLWRDGDPDPAAAGPLVLASLRAVAGEDAPGGGEQAGRLVVAITAQAAGPHGSRFVRTAVAEIVPSAQGATWRLLQWGVPAPVP